MPPRVIVLGCLLSFLPSALQAQTTEPEIVVRQLTLSNVHQLSAEQQQRIVQDIQNHPQADYRDRSYLDEAWERVRFEFQRRGYVKVTVDDPTMTIIEKDGSRETVDLDFRVTEGDQYRLKELRFTNETVFSTTELRSSYPIADGETFDLEKIRLGLENLRELYSRKGYVNFSAVPQTNVDEESRMITLLIDLDAGSVFRLGKLTVLGEESVPGAREKLLKAWESYEGKVYDFRLLYQFLGDVHARPEVKPDQIFQLFQDPQANLMNVSITLVKPPLF